MHRACAGFLALLVACGAIAAPAPDLGKAGKLPDFIDARVDGDDLILELQNQGPGRGKEGGVIKALLRADKGMALALDVPAPVEAFEIGEVRVPLANLGADKKTT